MGSSRLGAAGGRTGAGLTVGRGAIGLLPLKVITSSVASIVVVKIACLVRLPAALSRQNAAFGNGTR
ncbi:hypothetical protein BOSE127_170530 [Bosea sp. 127]|nr:hypothetical protein BOSE127_170530 [Bosea sp. 127]